MGGGGEFASIAPADGAEIWKGREAASADIEAAVDAARAAFPGWRRTPLEERIALVRAFAKLLEAAQGRDGRNHLALDRQAAVGRGEPRPPR